MMFSKMWITLLTFANHLIIVKIKDINNLPTNYPLLTVDNRTVVLGLFPW